MANEVVDDEEEVAEELVFNKEKTFLICSIPNLLVMTNTKTKKKTLEAI